MGVQAAGLLVDRIAGGAQGPPQRIVLGTDLIVRMSSLRRP
jgi:DNA-binding LacI/PurR family transcriptional regulator